MGYYSTIIPYFVFKTDLTKKEKDEIDELLYLYGEIDENGMFELSDYKAKWGDTEEIFRKIAKYIQRGGECIFVGEDDDRWGYFFDDDCMYGLIFEQHMGPKLFDVEAR